MLEFRGEVVSIVDLGVLLGSKPAPERLSTRIILVDRAPPRRREAGPAPAPRALLGLIAEHVDDLAPVAPDALTASPVPIPDAPYLGGLAETDAGMVQLILVDKILALPTGG